MKPIAILSPNSHITAWIEKDHPNIQVFAQSSLEFLAAKHLILVEFYKVYAHYYQVYSLWRDYLAKNHENSKLLVLGWKGQSKGNYISISDMDKSLDSLLYSAQTVEEQEWSMQESDYGLVDTNLKFQIDRYLKSHKENNLRNLLNLTRDALANLEDEILEGYPFQEVIEGKSGQELRELNLRLGKLWEKALPYFELIPQYNALKTYYPLKAEIQNLLNRKSTNLSVEAQPLSSKVGDFLKRVVSPITKFYHSDKVPS